MELSHFSKKPVGVIRNTNQVRADVLSPCEKPRGLWVSVDGEDDWPSWCEAEAFGDIGGCLRHRVTLQPDARILYISDGSDFKEFERKYGHPTKWRDIAIDWRHVASEYDGLIIAPYQWEHRLSSMWYYGWDCASGCVWRARAIKSVELIEAAYSQVTAA